ncbi:MAG TPA: VOC family protein [Candidatus Paceibacterota bacterium]|nr:VOC family protein [Candidatus Paceibacterota bacterium]
MANPVIHFEIQADDVERAKKFYATVFGWDISQMMTKDDSHPGSMNYWGLKTRPDGEPGINGGMYERAGASQRLETYDCTIKVDDIDAAIGSIKAQGGLILMEKSEIPGVGFFARAKDTEGNLFGLMQPTEWQAR